VLLRYNGGEDYIKDKLGEHGMLRKLYSKYYLDNSIIKTVTVRERESIEKEFNQDKWSYTIKYIVEYNYEHKRKMYITKNSYKLSKKIKEHLGIEVFPVIFPLNAGYWQKSCGAWSWYMIIEGSISRNIGSNQRTQDLLLNKIELVIIGNDIIGERRE
jgi:hypothetical protein